MQIYITLEGDINNNIRIFVYADASYGVDMDGKSHTGLLITLDRGPIFVSNLVSRNVSQNLVARPKS